MKVPTVILLSFGLLPAAASAFDHGALDSLLKTYVRDGFVDYAGLASERHALEAYVRSLSEADVMKMSRGERMALFINAYNACTLQLILEHGGDKLGSIKEIPKDKRWKHRRWNVGGRTYSLDDLEHKVLRPEFRDPRIHAAVNCASKGCPPLRAGAFTAANLEQALDEQCRAWVNNPRYVTVRDGKLWVNPIFNWFGEDFTRSGGSVPKFIVKYAEPELRRRIEALGRSPKVKYLQYDWSLNRVSSR